jgi:hypothetical protein
MAIFKNTPPIVSNGLVLYLDAGNRRSYVSGSTAWNDLSGQNNNGTLNNGPLFSDNVGGNIVFDGINDWVSTSYKLIEGTDASRPIILSFWINPNPVQSAVTNNPIFIGSAFYSGFGLQYTGTVYRIWLRMTSGTYADTLPLTPGQFQYVTLVWGGSEDSKIYSYINGNLNSQRSITYSNFNQNLNSYPLRVALAYTSGGSAATGYFTGNIANLKVYHRNLSAQEILQNYNATKSRFNLP